MNQSYAVSIYDINGGDSFGINEDVSQHSASVTKLLVATTVLDDIEKGDYSLQQPAGDFTLQWQLEHMINQSDNDSWAYFDDLLGLDREQQEADELGLTGVDMYQTHMTTRSVSQLLLELYEGNVLNAADRELLFSYMQNTDTENRISAGIPRGVTFYHKAGTYEGEILDAAIVLNPTNPFILVIYTNDDTGLAWATRFRSFQKATQLTYDYFSRY